LNDFPSASSPSCGRCESHDYDKARAVGTYDRALQSHVIALKSSPHLPGKLKNELMAAFERTGFANADLIVPVPLSKKRAVERGHNQAGVIGKYISSRTRLAFDGGSLERTIDTPMHRVGMDRKARELTVKNIFKVARPRIVNGRNIVLIDDVFTSGATAAACASVLKKNGASKVFVFTLARAVKFN
jgi:ComF family protein